MAAEEENVRVPEGGQEYADLLPRAGGRVNVARDGDGGRVTLWVQDTMRGGAEMATLTPAECRTLAGMLQAAAACPACGGPGVLCFTGGPDAPDDYRRCPACGASRDGAGEGAGR